MPQGNPKPLLAAIAGMLLTGLSSVAAAAPQTFTDHARVTHVEPAWRIEYVREPQRVCETRPGNAHRPHRPHHQYRPHHQHGARPNQGTATFVGAVIGGAIGHQLTGSASDRSRAGATLASAAIGATLANAGSHSRHAGHGRYDNHNRHSAGRRHCTTTTVTREHRYPDGYNVTYVYRGNQFQTRMRNHPGRRIPVTITLSTARY